MFCMWPSTSWLKLIVMIIILIVDLGEQADEVLKAIARQLAFMHVHVRFCMGVCVWVRACARAHVGSQIQVLALSEAYPRMESPWL